MDEKNNSNLLSQLEKQYLLIEEYYINTLQKVCNIDYEECITYFKKINQLPILERMILLIEINQKIESKKLKKIQVYNLYSDSNLKNEKDIILGLLDKVK